MSRLFHFFLDRGMPRPNKNPMRIGIGLDQGKVWKSNIVGFPFSEFGHKSVIRFCKEGRMLSPKNENLPLWGSQSGEIRVGVLKAGGRGGAVALGIGLPIGDGFEIGRSGP
ncbi:hypothetical protein AVEN_94962-1 [Araneus ventricosus]|uniref:Uncharacterized protein n=1 Tax=Araneus ventricosus TaxID=182803 RepID=A0A4Y2DJU6_ARAVE|nr:hypothetical protein AVEN_94962-1 [Araneus ventricosus]